MPDPPPWSMHTLVIQPRMAWMLYYHEKKSVKAVCEKFSISRKTFAKWWSRFKKSGFDPAALTDRSRKPKSSPKATSPDVVARIVEAKEITGFGQRRLKVYLEKRYRISLSEHTIWKILKRHRREAALI